MSINLTPVDGVLYSESGEVVKIIQNNLADSESEEVENILQVADQQKVIASNTCESVEVDKRNSEPTPNYVFFKPLSQQAADEDTSKLYEWLEACGLPDVFPYLKDAKVTFDSLEFLDRDDIRDAIPHIGLRAKFRNRLFEWRKQTFGIEDDNESLKSEIRRWMQDGSLNSKSSMSSPVVEASYSNCCLKKDLRTLLAETSKGRSVLEVYATKEGFQNKHRDELINIIIEETICQNIHLRPQDFAALVSEIYTLDKNMSHSYKFIF